MRTSTVPAEVESVIFHSMNANWFSVMPPLVEPSRVAVWSPRVTYSVLSWSSSNEHTMLPPSQSEAIEQLLVPAAAEYRTAGPTMTAAPDPPIGRTTAMRVLLLAIGSRSDDDPCRPLLAEIAAVGPSGAKSVAHFVSRSAVA